MATRFGSRISSKQAPIVSGQGGGGGTCPPTFVLTDAISRSDALTFTSLKLPDTIQRGDVIKFPKLGLADTIQRGDNYRLPTITITPPETLQRGDVAIFSVGPLTAVGRSGTPDSDDWGDAWTDNTVGNTGTNHGNETPLNMSSGLAGVGVKLAWAEINLTRFTGLTAIGNAHTITGVFTNANALVAATITLSGGPSANGGGASRGFTESTITQSNQPATPTGFVVTATLAAGATNATLTFTLTNTQMNTILGKWATLQFQTSSTVTATPDTVVSREGTAGNRMTITFKAQR